MSRVRHWFCRIPYRCSFCRDQLKPLRLYGLDFLRLLLFLRPYRCPHCFCYTIRPFAWIGRLPLIGRLFS